MSENTTVKKRERRPNYTPEEKTYLAELIAQYQHIIEDKRTGEIFYKKKRDAWSEVTKRYNRNCITGHRETGQLRSLYDNMKQQARKNDGECLTNTTIRLRLFQKPDNIVTANGETATEEEAVKVLQNMRNKMNETRDSYYKPNLVDSDGVEPLSNPYDSAAVFFRDNITVNHSSESIDPVQFLDVSLPGGRGADTKCDPLHNMTEAAVNNSWDTSQSSVAHSPAIDIKMEDPEPPPQQSKRPLTTEALKRLYFRKKCRNANLERKKILQEILHAQQKHNLEMIILRRNLDTQ